MQIRFLGTELRHNTIFLNLTTIIELEKVLRNEMKSFNLYCSIPDLIISGVPTSKTVTLVIPTFFKGCVVIIGCIINITFLNTIDNNKGSVLGLILTLLIVLS